MENAIIAGLSKQIVLTRALDTTANNIANQTTAGFKADHVAFAEHLRSIDRASSGDPFVSLVSDPDTYTDFGAGAIEQTFRDLDFAIGGDGFFAVETAAGVRYTRDGRFSVNAFGELVTRSGELVLDNGGSPILLDPDRGPIVATAEGELQQDGSPVARLGVFIASDLRSLRKSSDNLFAATEELQEAASARVRQGFTETSNVNPVAAMTDLIEILRAYEQAAQMTDISNDLARRAVQTLSERA
ncbi:MAG: flagellar basal-body rod protein FlgF [Parvularculaceae bacterium]